MTERDKHLTNIQHKLGERDLLEQLAEEAAELARAALKVVRASPESRNSTDISLEDARADLTEEIVDVLNAAAALVGSECFACLLELHLSSEKWERWVERIEEARANE